ncbi:tRNA (guanine-N(7)-)-methyltransferase non-catalytic subunit wdr4 [Nasonia vitripennis]|uniref:tRNA (guanine-N(7)-)-methyltransferase non-catalytic subunit wuho n=1 Tax=Nasonia vitripennis TaxID=7425 RepID=A0A7M7HEC5_NASVI|nr:tRNA (guanine-N(7)-)-methyltransferase non-catalytic subunit wdr4 [Nasonia vitripennis]
MSFSIYDSNVILCSGDNVLVYNLESKTKNVITLPKLVAEKEIKAHNREDIESFHTLTSVAFSDDGQYFLVCTNRKQLCLYSTRDGFKLVSNRTMPRAASRVRFHSNNDVVVADKSGDAYLFSSSRPDEAGQLLLGHLSMLLDILVTDDQKYVITADRDEKIRVSMFPNSYNILSYCLGHKNFVTNIAIVPHDKDILVSSGGDGTLMFWDFKTGREILRVYFHEKLSQNDLLKLNQTLKENDLEEDVTVSPVKHLKVMQVNNSTSVVAVTFYCSSAILFYSISNKQDDLKVEYLDFISIDKEPLECQFYKDHLWILTDSKIEIYKFDITKFVIDATLNTEIKELNEQWKKLYNTSLKTLLPVLYKRKFDSVQEYQERKKTRLIK